MASWAIPGLQHSANSVEEVLDVLDRQSEGDLLHNLRDHLAAVGVTRIADLLRWEALLHLALQDTTIAIPAAQPGHTGALFRGAECPTGDDAAPSDDDFNDPPSMPEMARPTSVRSTHDLPQAACRQLRPGPPISHSTRHVPLAERMRQVSKALQNHTQCESAAHACQAASTAAELPAQPPEQRQPASCFSRQPPNIEAATCNNSIATNMASHGGHARGMQPATERQHRVSPACTALPVHDHTPATLRSTAGLMNTEAPGHTSSIAAGYLPEKHLTRVDQGGDTSAQRREQPAPITQALLQRWLAYRPPPGYFSGLKLSQCVPGCKFLVDSFSRAAQKSGTRSFFLTHFHYDHYGGLSKTFSAGTVYCTPETARLVQLKLKVSATRIKTANIGEPFQVSGCTVTFLPANHCPGAAMVVFERPHHAPVLHCGDCRYHAEIFQGRPELRALQNRAILHLDTTYCSPEHRFPLQAEVVAEVVRLVRAAIQQKKDSGQPPPLLVFGSYTIGKERIFMEVALALNMKVYVEQDKWNVLRCLDMRVRERQLITRNMNEAGIHVLPMRMIRSDKLKELLSKHGGFGAVVAFKPTGWTFKGGSSTAAPAASSAPPPASNHHAKATDGTATVPLLVTHPSPAPLQDFLNQPRGGADRRMDSFSKRQTDAHGLCEVDAAQDISTACAHARDGHMGELCDVSAGAGEEGLDDDEEDLFALDASGHNENNSVAANRSAIADGRLDAAKIHAQPDQVGISRTSLACGDGHPEQVGMLSPRASDAADAAQRLSVEDSDASDHVVDLCFSQCSPRPALQPLAQAPSNMPAPSALHTRGGHAQQPPPPNKRGKAAAAAAAAAPNAMSVLMQSARCSAQDTCGEPVASTAPKPVPNALSLMMQSAKRNADTAHGGAGKQPAGGRSGAGKRRRHNGHRAGVLSTGVDPDACAPWVSVKSSGPAHIIEVPYSEHSSFDELREFVRCLRPVAVVPTVGGSASATPAMLRMLGQPLAGEAQ